MRPSMPFALVLLALAVVSSAQEATIYSTDFTTLDGWTVTPGCAGPRPPFVWAADATPDFHLGGPFLSPPASLNFNDGVDIGGILGSTPVWRTCGWVTSDPIDLSVASGTPTLRYYASWHMEAGCGWDVLSLKIRSAVSGELFHEIACFQSLTEFSDWKLFEIPLQSAWGKVEIEFGFDTVDDAWNGFTGVFIDDLSVMDVLPSPSVTCPGDGSGTPCPCWNEGAPDQGCTNSTGQGALLGGSGSSGVAAADLALVGEHLPAGVFGVFFQGTSRVNGGAGTHFGDGLRCAGGAVVRLEVATADVSGHATTSIDLAVKGSVSAGDIRIYQLWYRDPAGSPCGAGFNLTNGIEVTWTP